jgi:hypothetical protein
MTGKAKKSSCDNRSVDIEDQYAIEFWAKEFGVTQAGLKAVVLVAGTGLPDVMDEHDSKSC